MVIEIREGRKQLINRGTKRLGFVFGMLLLSALMISPVMSQDKQSGAKKADPGAQTPAQTVTIDGKVSAVSETSVTIVDAAKAEKTIAIDANTKITKSGKEATAADIKAEDSVVVIAKAEGEALTAISIKVA